MTAAKAWALRCQLELQNHNSAVFSTLTYDEAHVPPTLEKQDLQKFLRRLRKELRKRPRKPRNKPRPPHPEPIRLRFFASGEYGETRARPHYHAILFGPSLRHAKVIEKAWGKGNVKTDIVTPARIAYCAGYTSKKIGFKQEKGERIDPETGEVYEWQPPFIQMSRQPGIGGEARKFTESWRMYAISNGTRMPVPQYLHKAWEAQATVEQLEQLEYEKQQHRQGKHITRRQLEAAEQIAIAKQRIAADKRKY